MRARLLPLLDDGDRDLAETLTNVGMLLQELPEPDRAREPSRAPSHDRDADLDALVARIGRRADRVGRAERRGEIDRPRH